VIDKHTSGKGVVPEGIDDAVGDTSVVCRRTSVEGAGCFELGTH
jgi:hypothetical protein